jgi:hypothetical protein
MSSKSLALYMALNDGHQRAEAARSSLSHEKLCETTQLHRAPRCSSRNRKCHKLAANSQSTLELETEEWVSG